VKKKKKKKKKKKYYFGDRVQTGGRLMLRWTFGKLMVNS
jgi:hypothetical protein